MATDAKIYILNVNNYNTLLNGGTITTPEGNTISLDPYSLYFVRENTDDNILYKTMSLYVGDSKQADLLDISDDERVTFNDVNKEFNIPSDYQIRNKLLFCEYPIRSNNPEYYSAFMWNGTKFVSCFGTPNNVVVVQTLPQSGIQNYVYVVTDSQNSGLYVYSGSDFINILQNYTTLSQVQEYVDENIPSSDNLTVLQKIVNNTKTFYGAGADMSGKDVTYINNGISYSNTSNSGAHIYNSYYTIEDVENNVNYYKNTAIGKYSNAFGEGTIAYTDYITVLGKYNNSGSTDSDNYLFVIGNGTSDTNRSDVFTLDQNGNVMLYGIADASHGNITSATGSTLTTIREIPSGTLNTNYVDSYLPSNSHEILLSDVNDNTFTVTSITINDISHVMNSTTDRTNDYSCVYIFNKNSSVTEITDLMPNFTSTNTTQVTVNDEPPKIYLLNPDLDISSMTIIHIFIFYDGFNVCAIVAGYEG